MRAIQVDRYGGPEVLEVAGVADPVAGPRQVVVEVAAADVLFLDCQIRGGWGEMFGVVPPYVPGNGVAGVVVSVGDGVDRGWLGRQVVAVTAAARRAAMPSARSSASPGWSRCPAIPNSCDKG